MQRLANDNLFPIVKQIISLLHRLWESRNTFIHQGNSRSVKSEVRYIHNYSNFHELLSCISRELSDQRRASSSSLNKLPALWSNTQIVAYWVIIMKRCSRLPSRPCLISIFFQSEHMVNLSFKKAASSSSPFLLRCLRSTLSWILAGPYNCHLKDIMVISENSTVFNQVGSHTHNVITLDIQHMIKNFGACTFHSFEQDERAAKYYTSYLYQQNFITSLYI